MGVVRYSQILLSRLVRLRRLLSRLVLPLLVLILLSFLLLETRGCLDEETKLAKLKKLINKKIKLDMNEKYRSEKKSTNQYISFIYIHELTASDYVDYVLNKSDDYDCVLFVIDVENTNGQSMFDRKNLILLELFNRVARTFILGNFSLYSEGGSTPSATPIFFFYINMHKPTILPLKYIHAINEVPEFFYVGKETFLHLDYYSKVRPNYILEDYLKMKGLSERDKAEMSNKILEAYFLDFIRTHNRGGSASGSPTPLEGNSLEEVQKYFLTIGLVVLFSLLYLLLQLVQRWPSLMFACSYVLFLTCLSGIFHCLINKSEFYNTAKNLDSILHKYIYRSTSTQYVYEGVAFSFFIFLITFALFLLCRYSPNRFVPRRGKNVWLTMLVLLAYASLDVIHEINLYKVYYSTYFFFPPIKFFRK
ncbi:Uncharacterized protein PCOAH_00003460 [Plasmodium coatneyi]|uniref:Uncharacterized protein n=1 Tax=Plasmodium coatneyi TaxID=208452 RepID=A0A1B1DTC3_9APIC|nr:Uncharacterized protein PCOAH_00003460 [Plasmodium coatneyi]ANQ06023.1 Uncharacterized protein PCOAH_00003460 [Plasmodium coatneyi]